ncbi:MAG: GNAT family N-acetyltransferase [Eubacteriales bacterium]|jgi:ribosomal protein S18 acetylase RimI-like enzyme|nr:GNAT family N-acetyltransferase [Clostridiales bacterium]
MMDFLSSFEQSLGGYTVEKLTERNYRDYYSVFESNADYWEAIKGRPLASQDCLEAVCYCPDNFDKSKVYCLGIRKHDIPVAVVSLLEDYPDRGTSFIGLLLVDGGMQREGIGTEIVTAIINASDGRFDSIRLSVEPSNTGALRFWQEQGFTVDEVEYYKETENLPMRFMLGA